jgi:serine/threonine protein kinase
MIEGKAPNQNRDRDGEVPPPRGPTATPFTLSEGYHETLRDTDDSIVEIQPGTILDNQFEIVRLVGRGGMAVVYEVRDHLTRQRLALKAMLPSIMAKPQAAERFVQEVNIIRRLRHPGIVAVYDVRQSVSLLYFTMEYLDGQTLREILQRHRRLSLGKAAGVVHRVCKTLEYAHQYTVHRDISPENIMVLSDANVRLLDFGIAKARDCAGLSDQEVPIGKTFYMSPEQRENPAAVDGRTDVFALGVVLFEMLTGELPSGYNRLSLLRPDLPPECEQIVEWALAPRNKRCGANEFRRAIVACYRLQQAQEAERPPQKKSPH